MLATLPQHWAASVSPLKAAEFMACGVKEGLARRDSALHAAGFLAVDRWQGEERVQMRLTDVAVN